MSHAKISLVVSTTLAGLMGFGFAQTAAQPAAPDAAALQAQQAQYAEVLAAEAAKSRERLAAINQQLQSLDQDIESRIDRVVKLLSSVKDSTDSKGRVRTMKSKAIAGLKKSIDYYVREREKLNQARAASGTDASKAGLAEDAAAFNTRVDKRVDQITSLANSLTQHEEFGRYERYRNNEYDYNAETTEFKRFEKDVSASAKAKAEIVEDLRSGIAAQQRSIKELRDMLLVASDAARKARIQEQIDEKEEIVADRRERIEALLTAEAPTAKPISSKGAFEIDKLLAD